MHTLRALSFQFQNNFHTNQTSPAQNEETNKIPDAKAQLTMVFKYQTDSFDPYSTSTRIQLFEHSLKVLFGKLDNLSKYFLRKVNQLDEPVAPGFV